jgi:hypothetical protein
MATESKTDWAKAKSTKERAFRTIENEFFKFEAVGDSIEGYLVEKHTQRMRPNSDGTPNVIGRYKLQQETETGEPHFVEFLGGTDIDSKLEGVEINEYIKVTKLGSTRTASGNQMNQFQVQVAE